MSASLTINDSESHASAALREKAFLRALCLEKRRAERSRKPFLLVLIRNKDLDGGQWPEYLMRAVAKAERMLANTIRETDPRGWYREFSIYGLIFTEVGDTPRALVRIRISEKINAALKASLPPEQLNLLELSFYFYPECESGMNATPLPDQNLYPDIVANENLTRFSRVVKRAIDILGSAVGIAVLSPLFAVIAVLIKLNSRGPVLFKQTRVGQYGAHFTFLKFRSMSAASDSRVHKDYIRCYIQNQQASKQPTTRGDGAYKLTHDPRVTRVGRILRVTSLDELPQLFNVLRGDMSLVGPRPPIPYELELYDFWHMRRLLEARPGITGLWQVMGRSSMTFDDMVRLDLRYARTWSLWLDFKILLRTPAVVVSGNGAY